MKIGSFAKVGTVVATCAITLAGLSTAPAAMADPAATPAVSATTLVGFGSDTTQDLLNEIAKSINTAKGSAWIASYDAMGNTTVVAKPGGAAIPRANGSGEGFKLLQVAKGTLGSSAIVSGTAGTSLTVTTSEAAGQVDFSRSSGNGTGASSTGMWSYVPFAKDALTLAVNPLSAQNGVASLPATIAKGSSSDSATTLSWYSIYHCMARYVYTNASNAYIGVGADTTLPTGATKATVIKPLLPKYGSGTRKYFVGLLGYTDSATLVDPTSADTSCITDTFNGTGINEHDGTAIKGIGAGAIAPFSIPQWVAQAKAATTGVVDRRNGVVLLGRSTATATATTTGTATSASTSLTVAASTNIAVGQLVTGTGIATNTTVTALTGNTVTLSKSTTAALADGAVNFFATFAPTTGTGATVATNTSFPEKRTMFNVLPYGKLTVDGSREKLIFNGNTSLVCEATASITKMGFIPMDPAGTGVESCGYIENRFGAASVASPAVASAEFAQVLAGTEERVDITVEGNQEAGTINVYGDDDAYAAAKNTSGAIAVGANDFRASYAVTIPSSSTAGTVYNFKGDFTPNDTSIFTASAKSAAVPVKAVGAYTVTLNDIPSRAVTGAKVAVTATVAAGASGSLVGGNLTLVNAAGDELASTYLPARATKADLSWTATAGTTALAVKFEPENSSVALNKTSDSQSVYVAASASTATVAAVANTGWGVKTGSYLGSTYFGKVRTNVGTIKPAIKVTIAKVGTVAPTGTVKVLISTSKTGGTVLSTVPVTLAADGTATITLPATTKWRVTGTSGGVNRFLNVVYSGDNNYYSVTKSILVSITN